MQQQKILESNIFLNIILECVDFFAYNLQLNMASSDLL